MNLEMAETNLPVREADISVAKPQLQSFLPAVQDESSFSTGRSIADVGIGSQNMTVSEANISMGRNQLQSWPRSVQDESSCNAGRSTADVRSQVVTVGGANSYTATTQLQGLLHYIQNESSYICDRSTADIRPQNVTSEADTSMATTQLQSLPPHKQDESPYSVGTSTADGGSENVAVKEEVVSPVSTVPVSLFPTPHLAQISNDEKVLCSFPAAVDESLHCQPHEDNGPSNIDSGEDKLGNKPQKELRLVIKRLPSSIIAAFGRKDDAVTTRAYDKHKKGLYNRKGQTSYCQSYNSRRSRLSSKHKAQDQPARPIPIKSSPREKIQNKPSGNESSSHGARKTIDELSKEELKALLIRSRATIRSLSEKLNEWKKSENEIFGRLIGKMMANIEDRRRKEGLKLHVHDLVCETILQDIEERRTRP